jgi:hypothetical protein
VGNRVSTAENYRRKAFELAAFMKAEQDPELKATWESMVRGYHRLAEHAEQMPQEHSEAIKGAKHQE